MTAPGGPARPARLAGFVLLGVAVVAVGLGVFSLTSNGQPSANTGHPPVTGTTTPAATTQPGTTAPGATTTTPGATSGYPSGQTTTVAPPPGTGTSASAPVNPYANVPVRVLNNSTVKGLADVARNDFIAAGFDVVEASNYAFTTLPTSTVYYTPEIPGQQAAAQALAQQFGMKLAVRTSDFAGYGPGVLAVVTKDFKGAVNGGK